MAIEDLDLEFEDEEEEGKSEALDIGEDLEFSATSVTELTPEMQAELAPAKDESTQEAATESSLSTEDATDPNLRILSDVCE